MDINCTCSVRLTGEGRATVGRYYVPEREMLQREGRALFGGASVAGLSARRCSSILVPADQVKKVRDPNCMQRSVMNKYRYTLL